MHTDEFPDATQRGEPHGEAEMNMMASIAVPVAQPSAETEVYAHVVAAVDARASGDESFSGKAWSQLVRGTSSQQVGTRNAFSRRMLKSASTIDEAAAERMAKLEALFAERLRRVDEGLSTTRVERRYNAEARICFAHMSDAVDRRCAADWGAELGHMLVLLSYMHLRSLNQTPGAEAIAAMMSECTPNPPFDSPSYVRQALKLLVARGHLLPVHRERSAVKVYRVTIFGFNAAEACRARVAWSLPKPYCPTEG